MSKRQVLILLGVVVAILSFLGFPYEWQKIILIILGILIVFIAYSFKNISTTSQSKEVHTQSGISFMDATDSDITNKDINAKT